jgi:hypothetical protein
MKGMADLAPPPCPAQAQQSIPGSPADLMLIPQQKAHRGTHQHVKATAYAGRDVVHMNHTTKYTSEDDDDDDDEAT